MVVATQVFLTSIFSYYYKHGWCPPSNCSWFDQSPAFTQLVYQLLLLYSINLQSAVCAPSTPRYWTLKALGEKTLPGWCRWNLPWRCEDWSCAWVDVPPSIQLIAAIKQMEATLFIFFYIPGTINYNLNELNQYLDSVLDRTLPISARKCNPLPQHLQAICARNKAEFSAKKIDNICFSRELFW